MRYYLIAGEASGDLHGANLMKELKKRDEHAEFRFLGGDLMLAQGGDLVKHYSSMAFMGFVEVLMNLREVLKNLKNTKADLLKYKPDALVLIDFPGFNLKIAEFAKQNGIKVFYYISPKVWAWNQKRVLKIKKVVDELYCILPFEVEFYKSWGMDVNYVGNPLLDAIDAHPIDESFKSNYQLSNRPIVALLPGSRKQEISSLLPDMLKVAEKLTDYQFVIAGAPSFSSDYYQQYLDGKNVPIVFNATYDLLANAQAAIVASGTATLETAIFKVPQVVVYKGNAVTIAIARALIKIRFISLVNLIMDKLVVKELIQNDCNPDSILKELDLILHNEGYANQMAADYKELAVRMGEPGASSRTAELIFKKLQESVSEN